MANTLMEKIQSLQGYQDLAEQDYEMVKSLITGYEEYAHNKTMDFKNTMEALSKKNKEIEDRKKRWGDFFSIMGFDLLEGLAKSVVNLVHGIAQMAIQGMNDIVNIFKHDGRFGDDFLGRLKEVGLDYAYTLSNSVISIVEGGIRGSISFADSFKKAGNFIGGKDYDNEALKGAIETTDLVFGNLRTAILKGGKGGEKNLEDLITSDFVKADKTRKENFEVRQDHTIDFFREMATATASGANWVNKNVVPYATFGWVTDSLGRTEVGEFFGGINESIGRMIPIIIASYFGVPPIISNMYFFVSNFGGSMEEAIERGASVERAWDYAWASAVTETLTEQIGGFKPGQKIPLKLLSNFANEALEEGIAEIASAGIESFITDDYTNEDVWSRVLWASLAGGISGALLTGGGIAVEGQFKKQQKASNIGKQRSLYEAINQEVSRAGDDFDLAQKNANNLVDTTINGFNQIIDSATEENRSQVIESLKKNNNNNNISSQLIVFDENTQRFVKSDLGNNLTKENGVKTFKTFMETYNENSYTQDLLGLEKDLAVNPTNKELTQEQQETIKYAEKSGVSVVYYTDTDTKINGFFADGVIYINTESSKSPMVNFFHELTHSLEGTKQYESLRKFVVELSKTNEVLKAKMKELGIDISDIESYYAEDLKKANSADSRDFLLTSEYVAYAMSEVIFKDQNTINELFKNRNLFNKVTNWLKNTIGDLKKPKGDIENTYLKELKKAERLYKSAFDTGHRSGITLDDIKQRNSLIGEKAVKNLMDSVEKNNPLYKSVIEGLEKAKQMEFDGATKNEIHKETLWYRSKDGNWKFEISDKNEKISPFAIEYVENPVNFLFDEFTVKDFLLKDSNLLKIYPDLGDVRVIVETDQNESAGAFHPVEKTIYIHYNVLKNEMEYNSKELGKVRARKIFIDNQIQTFENERKTNKSNDIKTFKIYNNITMLYGSDSHSAFGYNLRNIVDDFANTRGVNQGKLNVNGVNITIDTFLYYLKDSLITQESDILSNIANIKERGDLLSTLLHEIQHYIQNAEGWSRGGNETIGYFYIIADILTKNQELFEHAERTLKNKKLGLFDNETHFREILVKKIITELPTYEEKYNIYLRILGEMEARRTESHMDYSQEEIDIVKPLREEDAILLKQQTFAFEYFLYDMALKKNLVFNDNIKSRAEIEAEMNTLDKAIAKDLKEMIDEIEKLENRDEFDNYFSVESTKILDNDLVKKYKNLNLNEDISNLDGIPAIRLNDGSVINVDSEPTHVSFITKNEIDAKDIESGGWVVKGVYEPSHRSDTMAYVKRKLAEERNIEKRIMRDLLVNENDSPYWNNYPETRGELTKEKIIRYIKEGAHHNNTDTNFRKTIEGFNDIKELYAHTFYHGTANFLTNSLKPSVALNQNVTLGGGYDQRYFGISLTSQKNVAKSFSGLSPYVNIYTVILKKDAKVIYMPEISDSIDIEDHIIDLWKNKVDAVLTKDFFSSEFSENEIVIINPYAIAVGDRTQHRVYQMPKLDNKTLAEVEVSAKKVIDREIKRFSKIPAKENSEITKNKYEETWGGEDKVTINEFKTKDGFLKIVENPPLSKNKNSIYDFWVDENKRQKGIGTRLLEEAKKVYNNISAQVSNENSIKTHYKAGFRLGDNHNASLNEIINIWKISVSGSVFMEYKVGVAELEKINIGGKEYNLDNEVAGFFNRKNKGINKVELLPAGFDEEHKVGYDDKGKIVNGNYSEIAKKELREFFNLFNTDGNVENIVNNFLKEYDTANYKPIIGTKIAFLYSLMNENPEIRESIKRVVEPMIESEYKKGVESGVITIDTEATAELIKQSYKGTKEKLTFKDLYVVNNAETFRKIFALNYLLLDPQKGFNVSLYDTNTYKEEIQYMALFNEGRSGFVISKDTSGKAIFEESELGSVFNSADGGMRFGVLMDFLKENKNSKFIIALNEVLMEFYKNKGFDGDGSYLYPFNSGELSEWSNSYVNYTVYASNENKINLLYYAGAYNKDGIRFSKIEQKEQQAKTKKTKVTQVAEFNTINRIGNKAGVSFETHNKTKYLRAETERENRINDKKLYDVFKEKKHGKKIRKVIDTILESRVENIKNNKNQTQLYNHVYNNLVEDVVLQFVDNFKEIDFANPNVVVNAVIDSVVNSMAYMDKTFIDNEVNKQNPKNPEGYQYYKNFHKALRELRNADLVRKQEILNSGDLNPLLNVIDAVQNFDIENNVKVAEFVASMENFYRKTNVEQVNTMAIDSKGDYARILEVVLGQNRQHLDNLIKIIGEKVFIKGKNVRNGLLGEGFELFNKTSYSTLDMFGFGNILGLFMENSFGVTITNRLFEGTKQQLEVTNTFHDHFEKDGFLNKNYKNIVRLEAENVVINNLKDSQGNSIEMPKVQIMYLRNVMLREIVRNRLIENNMRGGDVSNRYDDGKDIFILGNSNIRSERKSNKRQVKIVNTIALFNDLNSILEGDEFMPKYNKKIYDFFGKMYEYENIRNKDIYGLELTNDSRVIETLTDAEKAILTQGLGDVDITNIYTPLLVEGRDAGGKSGAFNINTVIDLGVDDGMVMGIQEDKNPGLVDNINNVISGYAKNVANFYGLYRITNDLNKLFNTKVESGGQEFTLVSKMEKIDSRIIPFYEKLLRDMSGYNLKNDETTTKAKRGLAWFRKNFYRVSLGFNLKVIATQISSLLMAGAIYGEFQGSKKMFTTRLIKNMVMRGSKTKADYLIKNSPVYQDRARNSLFEVTQGKNEGFIAKQGERILEFGMQGINVTDAMINRALFITLVDSGYSNEQALKETENFITRYQSSGLAITKNEILRTDSEILKMFLKFMGEPMKVISNIQESRKRLQIIDLLEKNKEEIHKVFDDQIAQAEVEQKVAEEKSALLEKRLKQIENEILDNKTAYNNEQDAIKKQKIQEKITKLEKEEKTREKQKRKADEDTRRKERQTKETKRNADSIKEQIEKVINDKGNAKKEFARRGMGFAVVVLWQALLATGWMPLRHGIKDKKEEESMMAYLSKQFGWNLVGEAVGYLPFVRDIYGLLLDNYNVHTIDEMTSFNDLIKGVRALGTDIINGGEFNWGKHIRATSINLGQIFGVPAKRIESLYTIPMRMFAGGADYSYRSATGQRTSSNKEFNEAVKVGDEKKIIAIINQKLNETNVDFSMTVKNEIQSIAKQGHQVKISKIPDKFSISGVEYKNNKKVFAETYNNANYVVERIINTNSYQKLNAQSKSKLLNAIYNYYYELAKQKVSGVAIFTKERTYTLNQAYNYFKGRISFYYNAQQKEKKGN